MDEVDWVGHGWLICNDEPITNRHLQMTVDQLKDDLPSSSSGDLAGQLTLLGHYNNYRPIDTRIKTDEHTSVTHVVFNTDLREIILDSCITFRVVELVDVWHPIIEGIGWCLAGVCRALLKSFVDRMRKYHHSYTMCTVRRNELQPFSDPQLARLLQLQAFKTDFRNAKLKQSTWITTPGPPWQDVNDPASHWSLHTGELDRFMTKSFLSDECCDVYINLINNNLPDDCVFMPRHFSTLLLWSYTLKPMKERLRLLRQDPNKPHIPKLTHLFKDGVRQHRRLGRIGYLVNVNSNHYVSVTVVLDSERVTFACYDPLNVPTVSMYYNASEVASDDGLLTRETGLTNTEQCRLVFRIHAFLLSHWEESEKNEVTPSLIKRPPPLAECIVQHVGAGEPSCPQTGSTLCP